MEEEDEEEGVGDVPVEIVDIHGSRHVQPAPAQSPVRVPNKP